MFRLAVHLRANLTVLGTLVSFLLDLPPTVCPIVLSDVSNCRTQLSMSYFYAAPGCCYRGLCLLGVLLTVVVASSPDCF